MKKIIPLLFFILVFSSFIYAETFTQAHGQTLSGSSATTRNMGLKFKCNASGTIDYAYTTATIGSAMLFFVGNSSYIGNYSTGTTSNKTIGFPIVANTEYALTFGNGCTSYTRRDLTSGISYPYQSSFCNFTGSVYTGTCEEPGTFSLAYETGSIYNVVSFGFTQTGGAGIPSFVFPTPADNDVNISNLGIIINASCSVGNVNLYFDNNTNPVTKVVSNVAFTNWSINSTADGTYKYKAECVTGETNSTTRTWYLDSTSPAITLNPSNAFTIQNITRYNIYNSTLPINISVTDSRELWDFNFSIFDRNGTRIFNYYVSNIGGLTYNYTELIDFSNFTKNREYISKVATSDAHTGKNIKEYSVGKTSNKISLLTAEKNNIELSSDSSSIDHFKYNDRYSYTFNYADKTKKERTITLKSNTKIEIPTDTKYIGHFIVKQGDYGNWVDFENDENETPEIIKISDYEYKITFKNVKDGKLSLHSTGSLNSNVKYYQFYYGEYKNYTIDSIILSGIAGSIYANFSINSTIKNVTGGLFFNNSFKSIGLWTGTDRNIYLYAPIEAFSTSAGLNYSYYWNVTIETQDSNKVNYFSPIGTYSILNWGVDNCTAYGTNAFNFTIKDEQTGAEVTGNLSFSLYDYYLAGYPLNTQSFQDQELGKAIYSFCKYPDTSIYGSLNFIMGAPGYYSRVYKNYNVIYAGKYTGYLLPITTSTNIINFKIVDSASSPITNANMKISRTINGTSTIIYESLSDFAGQISTNLDQLYTYAFTINASGYPLKSFDLQPTSTDYIIQMLTANQTWYNNQYDGIRFKLLPKTLLFNASNTEWTNFTFELEGNNIAEIGINITNSSFECFPVSCDMTATGVDGGLVWVAVKGNATGQAYLSAYFQQIGKDKIYVNDRSIKWVEYAFQSLNSLMDLVSEINANTSPNTRSFLVAMVSIVFIGFSGLMGIVGTSLIIPLVLLNIFFMLAGVIHQFIAMIIIIFGIVIFIVEVMK